VDTPPIPVSTPPIPIVVPDTPVPRTCAPLDLVCIGPFTIPGFSETIPGQDEEVPGQHVTDVPAICDAAGFACIAEQNIPSQHLGDTPEVTVAVDFTGLDVFADPHAGELTTIGPFHFDVGPIPVDVCASTCPFPVPPEGETLGSVTVTVTIDGDEYSETVPLDQSV